jgi:hypothetical protein
LYDCFYDGSDCFVILEYFGYGGLGDGFVFEWEWW